MSATLEDALRALDAFEAVTPSHELSEVRQFLEELHDMIPPLKDMPEDDCYIVEHAFQRGVEMLNDDGTLLAVTDVALVAFAKERQNIPAIFCDLPDGLARRKCLDALEKEHQKLLAKEGKQ